MCISFGSGAASTLGTTSMQFSRQANTSSARWDLVETSAFLKPSQT